MIPGVNAADRGRPLSAQSAAQAVSPPVVQRQPKPQTGAPDPDAERAAAVAEAQAAAAVTTEQLEAQSDAEDALKLNWRKSKDKQYAASLGLKDKAQFRRAARCLLQHQQEITVKIRFFSGEAKTAYIRTISPAVSEFAEPEQVGGHVGGTHRKQRKGRPKSTSELRWRSIPRWNTEEPSEIEMYETRGGGTKEIFSIQISKMLSVSLWKLPHGKT